MAIARAAALVAINKLSNGIQQGMFQRLLGTFRQRVMFFCQHFAAEIKQGDGGVVTTKPYADCVEIAGFGDDRDSAAAPGGGLLINFFNQPAFDKLTRNFGYAGGGKLALLGNLNPRDWPILVNQAINRRAVKLFYEINITYLSLSARCHTFLLSYDLVTVNDGLGDFKIRCECSQVGYFTCGECAETFLNANRTRRIERRHT